MNKNLIYGFAIIAGLASCSDDYTDWAGPQSNAANEAVEKFTLTVQPAVASIDFATETAESIQLFSTNLQSGQTDGYTLTFSADDKTETVALTAASDGAVASAELQDMVATIYGKAPVERILNVKVAADVMITTEDGKIVSEKEAGPFTLKITLDAPQISEHYYLIGAPSSWDVTETSLPFNHSGKNVYDDPIFTCTFPVEDGEVWFAITDDIAIEKNDWSYVFGCAEGNGANGMEGKLKRRSELGDDGSWKIVVDGDAKFVRVTLNMMEYTYTIEKLNFAPYIYEIGNSTGWSKTSPLAGLNYDGQYRGFAYLDGEFKYKPKEGKDDWTGDWGKMSGDAFEGTLTADGNDNIDAIDPGFYMMEVDLAAMTYKHTLIETVGIIGSATPGAWDADTDMAYDIVDNSWNLTVDLTDGEIKFRANDNWDISWGGSIAEPTFNAGNIIVSAGNYTIKFIPVCDSKSVLTMTKN